MKSKEFIDNLEYQITGACIEVHKILGPGLLESFYQDCLEKEFRLRNINFVSEKPIAVFYKGDLLTTKFRADFYIEDCFVLEVKCVDSFHPVHKAQLLTYMKILKSSKGMLINFNCNNIIKEGKIPFINSTS